VEEVADRRVDVADDHEADRGLVYLVRERRHLWRSVPGSWTLLASLVTVGVVSALAVFGGLVGPSP
jgi:hypothetical protein